MASIGDKELAQAITHGVPADGLAPWDGVLNNEDVRRVTLFIRQAFPNPRAMPPPRR